MSLFFLMHEDQKVLSVDIDVFCNSVVFRKINHICNFSLMPIPMLKFKPNEYMMLTALSNWFFSRFFSVNRENFYALSNKLALYNNNRMFRIQYSDSFFTGAASLLDHYWLNPAEEVSIVPLLSDDEIKFNIKPKEWDDVNFESRTFSDQIGNIIEEIMLHPEIKNVIPSSLNLDSPDLTFPGDIMKRWVRFNNKLFCKKIYSDNEKGIQECQKQISISDYLIHQHSSFALRYIQDEHHPNICYSERFLGPNEEFLSCYQLMLASNTQKVLRSNIIKTAKKYGCKQNLILEYFNTIDKMRDDLHLTSDDYLENIGFIIDSKKHKIIRPAPIFGGTW